jgi:cytochrome P450
VVDRPWTVEAARRFGPVQAVARVATEPQRIGEVTVAPGEQVVVALGAANRDPVVFPDPDAFVLGRTVEPLTFGLGRHHCLGARLALLELEEIVGAIVARGTVETGPVVWNRSRTLCGPDSVPIRIVPHPT